MNYWPALGQPLASPWPALGESLAKGWPAPGQSETFVQTLTQNMNTNTFNTLNYSNYLNIFSIKLSFYKNGFCNVL